MLIRGVAVAALAAAVASAATVFYEVGAEQLYVVPPGVTQLHVTLKGAQGWSGSGRGGKGSVVTGVLSVTPGESLTVTVGKRGLPGDFSAIGGGGFRGGGGASELRKATPFRVAPSCGFDFTCGVDARVIVAAGGGSSGSGITDEDAGARPNGGDGGCAAGKPGVAVNIVSTDPPGATGTATAGLPGTQSAGGAAGGGVQNNFGQYRMTPGGLGYGGGGGDTNGGVWSGGGGGGYYGGGGGGMSDYWRSTLPVYVIPVGVAGGGGGSSWAHPSLVSNYTCRGGSNVGDGLVIIEEDSAAGAGIFTHTAAEQFYTAPPFAKSLMVRANGAASNTGGGGVGAKIKAPLPVSFMMDMQINVGGRGWGEAIYTIGDFTPTPLQGGWNGGGSTRSMFKAGAYSGGGGGGGTDIRKCANPRNPPFCSLSDRVIAAGGGGAAGVIGWGFWGGSAGVFPNGDGGEGGRPYGQGESGKGGNSTAGGRPGPASSTTAKPGGFGFGGNSTKPSPSGGAGAGGGWYGGGAADDMFGAGGGSSYASLTGVPGGPNALGTPAGAAFSVVPGSTGDGLVILTAMPIGRTDAPFRVLATTATLGGAVHPFGMAVMPVIIIGLNATLVDLEQPAASSAFASGTFPYADSGSLSSSSATAYRYLNSGNTMTGSAFADLSRQVAGLAAGTLYSYKVCGVGAAGAGCGTTRTFKTPAVGAPVWEHWSPPAAVVVNTTFPAYTFNATSAFDPNITYSVSSGTLPTGTEIDRRTGILAGEPNATGYYTFTIAANNSFGATDTPQSITIMVSEPTLTWVAYSPPTASVVEGTQLPAYTFNANSTPPATITYSVASGSLPPGVFLDPDSGLIKGTPAEGGNWTFEIAASNGAVTQSVPVPATIPVLGLPRFSAQSPPGSVVVDTAYGPYTFAAWVVPNATITYSLGPKGGLPPGMTGNPSTGALSGTPTATGTYNFTVIASVPWGSTASSAPLRPGTPHVIRVVNVPTSMVWTNYTPPMYAPVGRSYAAYRFRVATTSANGGPVELTYEVQPDGQVPEGLTLDEDTGRLFGVATAPGVFNFSTVAYAPDKLASAVVPANATIIAMTLPVFVNATPPATEVNATITPYRFVATCEPDSPISYGYEGMLPAGMVFNPNGTFFGTPQRRGTQRFNVTATNIVGTTVISVALEVASPPEWVDWFAPPTLVGTPYRYTVAATRVGAVSPTVYSLASNSAPLPPGLILNSSTGVISGVTTTVGLFSGIVFEAGNNLGSTFTPEWQIAVYAGAPQWVAYTPPPALVVNVSFEYNFLAVSQPSEPHIYSLVNSTLPAGLTLLPNGTLRGVPSVTGYFNFTLKASNGFLSNDTSFAPAFITVYGPPVWLNTSAVHSFVVDALVPFDATFPSYTDPRSSVTYSVVSGSLPPGLSLNATSGMISGIVSTGGNWSFELQVANFVGPAANPLKKLVTIYAFGQPIWTAFTPPMAFPGRPMVTDYQFAATCFPASLVPQIRFRFPPGFVPGLVLNNVTGVISGTPAQAGIFNWTAVAFNRVGEARVNVSMRVQAQPVFTAMSPPDAGRAGVPYAGYTYVATAFPPTPIDYSIAMGAIPTGMSFNGSTGALTGTPNAAGLFRFFVSATNVAGTTTANISLISIETAILPSPNATTTPPLESLPQVQLSVTMIGGTGSTLAAGSAALLRAVVAAAANNSAAVPVIRSTSASNLTAPSAALRNLGNSTRSVVGTSSAPVTTPVAENDPAFNGPLPPTAGGNGRALATAAGCAPVDLSTAVGNVTVPAVAANLAVTLPESFYIENGASTGSQKAELLAQVANSLTVALLSNTSDPSTIPGVTALLNAWSACTGLPPALGVLSAIQLPIVYLPPTASADADTANWIVFTVTAAGTLVMGLFSYIRNVKPEARLLYRLATLLLAVTALAHLVMVLGGPGVSIDGHAGEALPVQWVRYAEWAVTAPLTIVMLGLLAGGHWTDMLIAVTSAELGIAAGFAAAVSTGASATWPLFTFGLVVGGLPVLGTLGVTFRRAARAPHAAGAAIACLYTFLALTSLVLYAAGYVIVWAVSDGGVAVTPGQAAIAFAVLELLTKPAFAAAIVLGRESIARYGSALGCLNTGADVDFSIPSSLFASSASHYKVEPPEGPLLAAAQLGEPRDVAFARLHAATGTGLMRRR